MSVFHAGHWLWQRPHSVHVAEVEQALPGEVLDLPDAEGGVLVELLDMASTVEGLAVDRDRLERRRARCGPRRSRLNQMLKKARKRCQATPIVGLSAMVIIQRRRRGSSPSRRCTMPPRCPDEPGPATGRRSTRSAGSAPPRLTLGSACARSGPPPGRAAARCRCHPEDGQLDVVGLPERRAEEPRSRPPSPARARGVVALADRHQHEDADEPVHANNSMTHS